MTTRATRDDPAARKAYREDSGMAAARETALMESLYAVSARESAAAFPVPPHSASRERRITWLREPLVQ